jgi:hypothetical protein
MVAGAVACDVCGSIPCPNPTFCSACCKADRGRQSDPKTERLRRLMEDDVSLDRTYYELGRNRRPIQFVVEAVMFSLRRGVDELTKPDTLRRLAQFDENQVKEVCRRVQAFKPEIAKAWTAEEAAALESIWRHSK